MTFATKVLGILTLVASLALAAPHGVAGDASACAGDCGQDGEVTVDELPDGTIVISAQGQIVGRSIFNPDQSVGFDLDRNGSVDETVPNCLDPRLLICAG
jgi:GTPase involved in cell partitioning and DNA repair